jgi:PAS domain S-box-containing protein
VIKQPNLDEVFRLAPNAYMVLNRELRYVAANDAYLAATASTLETLLGRHVFELFPNDPDDPNNASALLLQKSFQRVLDSDEVDVLAVIPYRVPRQTAEGLVTEERYWSATHVPLKDAHGKTEFILQHTVDITELQRLQQAASSDRRGQVEAGVLERAQRVQDTNRVLDAQRRQLLSLFEQAPSFMAFLGGDQHVFEMANTAYRQLTGFREVLGRRVCDALPEVAEQGFIALLDGVFRSGEPYIGRGVPIQLQRGPGGVSEDRFLDFIYQPIRGADGRVEGIFVQGHDITEQKRAEAALRESETRFRNMADHSPVMLWVTDVQGRCTYLSRAWYDFTGREGESVLADDHLSDADPSDASRIRAILAQAHARQQSFRVEYRLRAKDGSYRWVLDSASPRASAVGEFLGLAGSVVDIHDQKMVEQQIRQLNEELERRVAERTAELSEANNELESFSYSVSHDLRAPLRHITGFAQLLERRAQGSLDEVSRSHLKTISDAAKEGGKLVDDLLAFSRMGRAEMKRVQTSLAELVAEARRELEADARERTVRWSIGELPEVMVDPALFRLAIKNLLSNALKYTRERADPQITVQASVEQGEIHVWVQDNGVGFDMQYVDKLFGVFQRLHSAEQFEGTGIGLANVRRIINRHGGRVWAEGRPGQGATFHFSLPADRAG